MYWNKVSCFCDSIDDNPNRIMMCEVLGKPTMISILMSSHLQDGIGRDWRVSATFKWLVFTLRHVSLSALYLEISLFIQVHQKFCQRSWYILVLPGWIGSLERCALSRICFRSSWFLGTTKRLSNHRTPLWSRRKHLYFPSPRESFYLVIPIPLSWSCAMMTRS